MIDVECVADGSSNFLSNLFLSLLLATFMDVEINKTAHLATINPQFFKSQAKQSATLAATAAGTTTVVTVPKAGILGWFGMTTTTSVGWLSIHPMAIPGLACYAAVTVGVPAVMYATAHKKWKETSERMSEAFWNAATENPDVFAECLTHWSEKG